MPYKNKEQAAANKLAWRRANPEKDKAIREKYKKNHRYKDRPEDYKTEYQKITKAKREARIKYIKEQLGHVCCNCGTTENLEFDHINPALKVCRTPPQAMGKDLIEKELPNLQLLCYSCHVVRTRAQRAAAWHLYCQLSAEEQAELEHAHEEHEIKRQRYYDR